ncbi:MAG: hypothetical protein AAFQ80_16845 [Cyanobacteria bacterium J06621_8]
MFVKWSLAISYQPSASWRIRSLLETNKTAMHRYQLLRNFWRNNLKIKRSLPNQS